MISSHTIKSKNLVLKKREREKTVNTGAEYEAACRVATFFRKGGKTAARLN